MDTFVSNQTLINEILSFNPVPENLKWGKTLDPYLRELLAEQDKYIYLNQDKTLGNLQQRIAFVYGPLTKIWTAMEAEKESYLAEDTAVQNSRIWKWNQNVWRKVTFS